MAAAARHASSGGFLSKTAERPPFGEAVPQLGSVAERLIAPDSKSGGVRSSRPAPVGSNPTASVPETASGPSFDHEPRGGVFNPTTGQNPEED
jgi:hypothetical protein